MTAVDWTARWRADEGQHYQAEANRYDDINRGFGDALIEAASLSPGERVLDVGCGAGATTLAAARRVRPDGSVLGIDVSPDLLAIAGDRIHRAGLAGVELVESDAATYPFAGGTFDVVMSRNGLMFFADVDIVFASLARALRSTGRIAFTAPQGLDRNPWIMVAGAAAVPHIGMPASVTPGEPGPLGLADRALIEEVLTRAGFESIAVTVVSTSMCIGADVKDALAFISSIPIVREQLQAAPPTKRAAAIDAVEQALTPYASSDGVVIDGNGAWLVTARR